jgi:CheY-like chemotaxis protein
MSVERAKTILIVEDDALAAMTVCKALEEYRYIPLLARSGQEALCLAGSVKTIDLILIDLHLGASLDGIDGIDTARILQNERHIPVVFLSEHMEKTILDRMNLVDSYGCLAKYAGSMEMAASIAIAFQRQYAERKAHEEGLRKILAAMPDIISINYPEAVYSL